MDAPAREDQSTCVSFKKGAVHSETSHQLLIIVLDNKHDPMQQLLDKRRKPWARSKLLISQNLSDPDDSMRDAIDQWVASQDAPNLLLYCEPATDACVDFHQSPKRIKCFFYIIFLFLILCSDFIHRSHRATITLFTAAFALLRVKVHAIDFLLCFTFRFNRPQRRNVKLNKKIGSLHECATEDNTIHRSLIKRWQFSSLESRN